MLTSSYQGNANQAYNDILRHLHKIHKNSETDRQTDKIQNASKHAQKIDYRKMSARSVRGYRYS